MSSITIDMLNANQRQAVEWNDGPMLVLAGPGSGKTAVLTLRIASLIRNSCDESFRILGLTFTVKAATEMRKRILDLLGENTNRIQLRTYHSFCTDILRQHGSHLGLRPDFSVITDDKDRVAILGELLLDEGIYTYDSEDSLKKIDIMFTHGIDADQLYKYFDDDQQDRCRALQNIFRGYVKKLVSENHLDFGSMLYFTRNLLGTKPRIAKQVRTVYRHVCVDEFQDTNLAQYKVLRLIALDKSTNLFVVADEDQMIFQWNGANPKRLEELKRDYCPKIIQLPENYRCPVEVVRIANRLIAYNPKKSPARPYGISQKSGEGVITLEAFNDFEAEVNELVEKIKVVPRNCRKTCLVIARSNKLLVQVQKAMEQANVKAKIVSKHQDFVSPLVQIMYFSLKLTNSPDSRSILNKLCTAATLVNGITISAEEIYTKAGVEGLTLLRVFFFSLVTENELISSFAEKGQRLLCDSLEYVAFVEETFQILDELNKTDGGEDAYPDYKDDKANWSRISEDIRQRHGNDVSLHVFLQEMDLSPKASPFERDCVRLQTIHTAKGTEFKNVFLIGLAEDQFPTYFARKNGETGIQEERRNCFVAITRSSENLHLSYAKKYFGWNKEPSRFLTEMGL